MLHLRPLLLLSIFLVAGCVFGKPPQTPSAVAGDIPLTVVNGSNRSIFAMAMWPDSAPAPDGTNWLGEGMKSITLETGKQHTFSVKAGVYRVLFLFTDIYGQQNTRFVATTGAKGAANEKAPIEIKGATYLTVGATTAQPPPGVAAVSIPVIDTYGEATANCKAVDEPASHAEECCSRLLSTETSRCEASTD